MQKRSQALKKAQDNYVKRLTDKGHVKVAVWIPQTMRDEILEIAQDMRTEYEENQTN